MPADNDKPEGGASRGRRSAKRALDAEAAQGAPAGSPAEGSGSSAALSESDVTNMLRQLIMLIEAGTPVAKSLRTLSERSQSAAVRKVLADITAAVEGGSPLWQAFKRHPRTFDTVFVNLLKGSEASGTLAPVLERIVDYRERHELLRKRIRGGMVYPVILLVACFVVLIFISKFVMPEFKQMFGQFSSSEELPQFTDAFMRATQVVGDYWWTVALAALLVWLLYRAWWVRSPIRRVTADRLKLKLPLVGVIFQKSAVVEMTRTMSMLLKSGMPMMTTLELVRNSIHNRAMAQVLQDVRDSVERGAGLEKPLRAAPQVVPPVVTDMLVTGEETGRLDSIASQIASVYEEEVNIAIMTLSEALQPALTLLIGVLVVLLMLAVFLPIVDMLQALGMTGV